MESFIFGNKEDIYKNKVEYLLFLKNLLSRYYNSIPDSLAITLLEESKKCKNIIIETGVGASTIALFLGAVFNKKKLISFDLNKKKSDFIKKFIKCNICDFLEIDINKFLKIKNNNTVNKKNGLGSLKIKSNFFYLDSNHNINHILKEIDYIKKISDKKFLILLDDMNFDHEEKNSKFIEMIRFKKKKFKIKKRKLNFKPNKTLKKPVLEYIKNHFKKYKLKKSYFDKNYKNDMYNKIYGTDFFYNQISEIKSRSINKKNLNKFLKNRILYLELIKK